MPQAPKTQETIIDVATWADDAIFGSYPEGARSKDALFPPEPSSLPYIIPKRRYLYKRSDKRYPDQFWGEVTAYQVGCLLDVNVPPAFAATNSRSGDCGALIEWFYEDGKAVFTPGGSYMQKLMPDFDRKKGELHNFQYVEILCNVYSKAHIIEEPWINSWADMFLFDALIGNTDRHQDNWGLIRVKGHSRWTVAPLFDNGTSLGHERFEQQVRTWSSEKFEGYVAKGTHHIRLRKGDPKGCPHVELLQDLIIRYPVIRERMLHKVAGFNIDELARVLNFYRDIEINVPLTEFRKEFYLRLIDYRRNKILAALQ